MKKKTFLFGLIILLLSIILVSGCNDDNNNLIYISPLYGTWYSFIYLDSFHYFVPEEGAVWSSLVFDNTNFEIFINENISINADFSYTEFHPFMKGTYEIDNNKVIFTITHISGNNESLLPFFLFFNNVDKNKYYAIDEILSFPENENYGWKDKIFEEAHDLTNNMLLDHAKNNWKNIYEKRFNFYLEPFSATFEIKNITELHFSNPSDPFFIYDESGEIYPDKDIFPFVSKYKFQHF